MRLSACDFGDVTHIQGYSTLTAADVEDVGCVGCGVVYELVLLAAGMFLLECNAAIIFKLGNASKASSAP